MANDPNEQRTGVRTPIVLAVLLGIAGISGLVYVKKDDIKFGRSGSSPSGSFTEVCRGLEAGTPAFDAKGYLMTAATSSGPLDKPPDVRVADGRMVVKITQSSARPPVVLTCTIDLDKSGKAVARAQSSTEPVPR